MEHRLGFYVCGISRAMRMGIDRVLIHTKFFDILSPPNGARKHAWRMQARMAHASTYAARKHAWRTQACMAHASTHGARKHAWRTQAVWAKKLHLSSSYAKILGETNFPPREFPQSG